MRHKTHPKFSSYGRGGARFYMRNTSVDDDTPSYAPGSSTVIPVPPAPVTTPAPSPTAAASTAVPLNTLLSTYMASSPVVRSNYFLGLNSGQRAAFVSALTQYLGDGSTVDINTGIVTSPRAVPAVIPNAGLAPVAASTGIPFSTMTDNVVYAPGSSTVSPTVPPSQVSYTQPSGPAYNYTPSNGGGSAGAYIDSSGNVQVTPASPVTVPAAAPKSSGSGLLLALAAAAALL